MKHEELLAKVDSYLIPTKANSDESNFAIRVLQAIRATVELHNPFTFQNSPEETTLVCEHCQLGTVGDVYPCETIYAIEKELQ
jgi:heptaprenylglyceryl phosphate synthase